MATKQLPVVLIIRDGWGLHPNSAMDATNAVIKASTPVADSLFTNHPTTMISTCGVNVGLPAGVMGNSEVGHQNIGAGRIVPQELMRLNIAAAAGEFKTNPVITEAFSIGCGEGATHIVGLVSDGRVHSDIEHLFALLDAAPIDATIFIHVVTDGRDCSPSAGLGFLETLEDKIRGTNASIASVIGRYWAMDRDNRWERVEKAYRLIAEANGKRYSDPIEAINARYQLGETDEFIEPLAIEGYQGFSSEKDGLFFMNYRADRAREILSSLIDPTFVTFKRKFKYKLVTICGMIEYSDIHKNLMNSLFKPEKINNTLGQWLSVHNKKQFRLAETEKYPHVTFFFNAGVEKPNIGETHFMVASPQVLTYDLKPEMSADEVTANLTEAIESKNYDFIVANYANPDMVGHTGNLTAAVKACEAVDKGLGLVLSAIKNSNGILLITADHGNCEVMYDNHNNMPHTAHTLSLVPFIISGLDDSITLRHGGLSDIAPTILEILSLKKPKEMTGESLIKH